MNQLFHALHGPFGASASFDLGQYMGGGGFAMNKDRAASQNVYLGYYKEEIVCFPFLKDSSVDLAKSFLGDKQRLKNGKISCMSASEITREFGAGTDKFSSEKMSVMLTNGCRKVPNPEEKSALLKRTLLPSLLLEITYDNTGSDQEVPCFFAVSGMIGKRFLSDEKQGLIGITSQDRYGFAVEQQEEIRIEEFADFGVDTMLSRKHPVKMMLGPVGGILIHVPAGKKMKLLVALGFYDAQFRTAGTYHCSYLYTKYFSSISDVLGTTLKLKSELLEIAKQEDTKLEQQDLSKQQKFLIAQANRCYKRCTMLLVDDKQIHFVVNEGSYQMINTFDLLVDHLFYELEFHPWTVKNQLEWYAKDYSYKDCYGVSFAHDMGIYDTFSEPGRSCYEIPNEHGCFSFMTQEQLCNFILCAGCYVSKTQDKKFLEQHSLLLEECLKSIINRCGKDSFMTLTSDRCESGNEITTYDSLDYSLGKAESSTYLAVKTWAALLSLQYLFEMKNQKQLIDQSKRLAQDCATGILSYWNVSKKIFPAILSKEDSTVVLSVIEGLIYPYRMGLWDRVMKNPDYISLIDKLKIHCKTAIESNSCVFEDGGIKLSATSDNSWMSKIFLCEYIMKDILQLSFDYTRFDTAHESWWKDGCSSNPGIDQIFAGKQKERYFYYPRAVTNHLWLENPQ